MPKPLIALPCTARELEDALHRVCDHEGTWDAKITTRPPTLTEPRTLIITTTDETKGETK